MDNDSANNMWGDYLKNHLEDAFHEAPKTIHLFDTEQEANASALLIKNGTKKAMSNSLLSIQGKDERLPKIGDFRVITNFDGEAQCIIEITKVTLKPYFNIDENYAQLEGEGDKSLAHWKKKYWAHFKSELAPFKRQPRESMIVVCQEFEKVFQRK